jgi:hypothetical protein
LFSDGIGRNGNLCLPEATYGDESVGEWVERLQCQKEKREGRRDELPCSKALLSSWFILPARIDTKSLGELCYKII